MKTKEIKELEIVETGFEIIDLETFAEDIYGGDNTCNINNNNGICKVEMQK